MKLRAAFVRACWSSKLTLAHTGAVLGMSGGPECVDPCACIVWYPFRLLRRYLAYRPLESARIGKLFDLVGNVAPGHEPLHLLVDSAASLEFRWCPVGFCLSRPVLPRMPMPLSAFEGFFFECPLLDFQGSMQLLDSSRVRDKDKALLRGILSGGVWNVFPLDKVHGDNVPCRFCGGLDGEGHLFWECSHLLPPSSPPPVALQESPGFHYLSTLIKLACPSLARLVSSFVWLQLNGWRSRLALMLEKARSLVVSFLWLGKEPLFLTHLMSGLVGVARCGGYAHASGAAWFGRRW